jgi:integrase
MPNLDSKTGESPVFNSREVFGVKVPKYRRHKKNYARVVLNGREVHLGVYGSPESKANYERVVSEWLQSGRKTPRPKRVATLKKLREEQGDDVLTITELCVKYFKYAKSYYTKAGNPTSEVVGIQIVLRDLRKLYADTLVDEFGPAALRTVREELIRRDLARSTVNKQIGRMLRMFAWAVSEGLVKTETLVALRTVPGLKAGRCDVRETERVKPVTQNELDSIREYLNPVIGAMIDLQRLTGMRPGEVCQLRTIDLDRSGEVWTYKPVTHKVEHHGKDRVVFLGPQAQTVASAWLKPEHPEDFLFSPAEAERIRHERMRAARKSKVQPSQVSRAKAKPRYQPGESYTTNSYRRAIKYACEKAGIEPWHPNQLRHLAATNLRREFGIEIARAVLGHSSVDMTEVYAEMDATKARDAMAKSG